ncbi:gp53-like domain-containing protein [Pseudomonas sp. TWP3-2]|uniref:gp53-like domain-containing protein n=1 Tax=Pseudomonas sp. TWP3-2 TaxID=2804574 RepID=UPI003CF49E17
MSRASVLAQNDQEVQDYVLQFKTRPNGPTAPISHADDSLATTEFVMRAVGSFAGQTTFSTPTVVLTPAMAGRRIVVNGPATVTLPLLSAGTSGAKFYIQNVGSGDVVVNRQGSDLIVALANNLSSITIPPLSNGVLTIGDTNYVLEEGMSALKYSAEFATTLAVIGKERMPSGRLRQWGTLTTSGSGDLAVLFPEVFATRLLSLVAVAYIGGGPTRDTNVMVRTDGLGRTGFSVGAFLTGARTAEAVYWVAEGY